MGYKLQQNHVAEGVLQRLGDLENYPDFCGYLTDEVWHHRTDDS